MLLRLFVITAALFNVSTAFAPSPDLRATAKVTATTSLEMSGGIVDRRRFFANTAATVAILSSPAAAFALNSVPADNEIVKEQRTITGKLDINNAAVADYMKYPGLYPTIGGKIANNGPYKSVKDVYKVLSSAEQKRLKEYASELTVTPSSGLDTMRGRDPYRRSFNDYKEVKVNAT